MSMIDYSGLSPSEAKDFVLLHLKLDIEPVDKYFVPRWNLYQEQFFQIIQQEFEKESKKEIAIAILLLVTEACTRSQLNRILNTSLSDREIVEGLLPFYGQIKGLLEVVQEEALNFSTPLLQVVLKEKKPYQVLLEELTIIIREHSPKMDLEKTLQPPHDESPITNAVEKIQMEVLERVQQETREEKILVTIKPEALESVTVAFLPFIKSEQEQTLLQLFTTGTSSEPIYFNESRLILGDFFRRLKDENMLIGVVFYTELAKWLSQHFYFKNKKMKGFTPVNEESILAVMQDGDKPKVGIKFN